MEHNFLEELAEGFKFFAQLSSDLSNAKNYLDENDSQFARRMYLRTLFAFIEGNSFRLRQMALAAHNHRKNCFSNEEMIMLEEKEIGIKENGKLNIKIKYIKPLAHIRFSQNCYIKAIGGEQPNYNDNGWAQLNNVVTIRNRITHPRSKADLEITDEELTKINDAKEWYSNNVQFLL